MQIHVNNLTKHFGPRLVLDRISLSIQPGQTVALIGPSGGGKSTLLRCLNGLTTFDSGEISVGDHVLKSGNGGGNGGTVQQMRRLFGMIFQDFQLFPHLTALGNVIEAPMRVLGLRKTEAVDRGQSLLKRVDLADHAHAYPQQLSGGQKQRVAIARALAMEPRGLLCDEITSALDPELKNDVLNVLEDLKRDGMTLLMVTHEIGFARRAADRVVVLAAGSLIEDGTPAEVLDQPKHERVRSFLRRVLG
ncbi:MAG TPA: amino acid ABC transporter ATP-binding protein [Gemmataceae bacterium]|nr:amino acid ABC transporter ATP-binding protein [Gemmataceae bacterium]